MGKREKFGGITVGGIKQKEKKHLAAQMLAFLGLLTTFFGAAALYGNQLLLGYILFPLGLLMLIGVFVRAVKAWDY